MIYFDFNVFIVPAPAFLCLHQEADVIRSCFVVGESEEFDDEIQAEDSASDQSDREPEQWGHVKFNNTLVYLTAIPVVGKPHICNIHEYTHHRIKEEADLGPPPGPDHELASHHRVQAGETDQRHRPEICVLTVVQ